MKKYYHILGAISGYCAILALDPLVGMFPKLDFASLIAYNFAERHAKKAEEMLL